MLEPEPKRQRHEEEEREEDANWKLDEHECGRRDQTDWYERYGKVLDEDGNDISKHAPPALKVFWGHTYYTLEWQMRKARRDYDKEEADERNTDRINLLAEMKDWYAGLVQQEASLAHLNLANPSRRSPQRG